MRSPKLWLVAIPFFLAGCPSNPPVDTAAASRANKERRLAKAETVLSKSPVPRTYTIEGNQLQVVEVPVADTFGFVELRRCFIYRDQEFKQASMSCEQQPGVLISGAQ